MKFSKAYRGIPAPHRGYVKKVVASMNKKTGPNDPAVTPQKVWELMQREWEKQREEKARASKNRRRILDASHEDIEKAIRDLAGVRDLIGCIEDGKDFGFALETVAGWARATLEESCRNMEQALANLGVIKPEKDNPDGFGWFSHDGNLKSQMPKAGK